MPRFNTTPSDHAYVFAGGPGAGKTTVLALLADCGYRTFPDAARAIIRRRRAAGLSPRPAPPVFTRALVDQSIRDFEQFRPADQGPIFLDGALESYLAMLEECHPADTPIDRAIRGQARTMSTQYRYNGLVFLFPPWSEIYVRDSERDHSWEHAVRVYHGVRKVWADAGYELREVPPMPAAERADFVVACIEKDHPARS